LVFVLIIVAGCAGVTIHDDLNVPPGKLEGVQFAAKKYATYSLQGVKREQGWIYGFTEPYQVFILYMILEKEGSNDRQDMAKILESFEFIRK
jgi:hypothetical protein